MNRLASCPKEGPLVGHVEGAWLRCTIAPLLLSLVHCLVASIAVGQCLAVSSGSVPSARITRPICWARADASLLRRHRATSRRPRLRALLSRPDWNDDTSPRYSTINDPPPLFGVRPPAHAPPAADEGPGSPRGRPKTAGAVVPNHPLANGISADGETPRPVSSQDLSAVRVLAPGGCARPTRARL